MDLISVSKLLQSNANSDFCSGSRAKLHERKYKRLQRKIAKEISRAIKEDDDHIYLYKTWYGDFPEIFDRLRYLGYDIDGPFYDLFDGPYYTVWWGASGKIRHLYNRIIIEGGNRHRAS